MGRKNQEHPEGCSCEVRIPYARAAVMMAME